MNLKWNFAVVIYFCNLFSYAASSNATFTYDANFNNLSELLLKYQVNDEGIVLGEVILNDMNFSMNFESEKNQIYIFWPTEVFRNGRLELYKGDGSSFYNQAITEDNLETYAVNSSTVIKNSYHNLRVGIEMQESWLAQIKKSGSFWACLKGGKSASEFVEICTSPYRFTKTGLKMISKNVGTKVFFNDSQPLELSGELPLKDIKELRWFSQLNTGLSWNIKGKVPDWKPIEVIGIDANTFRISGVNERPLKYISDHFTFKQHGFLYEYKPNPFASDQDAFWTIHLQATKDVDLNFMTENGGIFTARIYITKAPNVLNSPFVLNVGTPQLTYNSQKKLRLGLIQGSKSTKSNKLKPTSDKNQFQWTSDPLKRGVITRSQLNLLGEDKIERSYYLDIYRGYPLDLGFQYTASSISGKSTEGGEMHMSYWAEDFFSLIEANWFRLRFGMQYKYFKPFKKLSISRDATGLEKKEVDIMSSTFDIKYRFVPGLWGRDETFGLMLAQHDFTYDTNKLNLLGAGFFWARSMPKYFDDLFNLLPFFRFPKWVNAEYIQFVKNSDPQLKLANVSHLNFYGKVMWTKNFYGDLGFGMRTYSFEDLNTSFKPSLRLFFLTMGLGINF